MTEILARYQNANQDNHWKCASTLLLIVGPMLLPDDSCRTNRCTVKRRLYLHIYYSLVDRVDVHSGTLPEALQQILQKHPYGFNLAVFAVQSLLHHL